MIRWLVAFAWTLALELPVYTLVLAPVMASWQRLAALVLAVNAVTHPLLWFAMPPLSPFALYLLAGESAVIVVEAALIALVIGDLRRAAAASALANLTSTVIGLAVMRAIG